MIKPTISRLFGAAGGALLLGCVSLSVWAQPATTANDAVSKAINSNPRVQAAWHEFLAAEDEQRSAQGGFLPQVDLGASAGIQHYDVNALNQERRFDPAGVNLTITQLLWDGFGTRSNVDRLSRERREAYYRLVDAAEDAALDAIRAYEDVQRFRTLVTLANENVVRHETVLDRINQRVRAGVGRSVDFEQATGRLALARSNLVIEQSNLHDVSSRYQRVVGEWPAAQLAPLTMQGATLPAGPAEALGIAYQEHPALAAAFESIQAANEQLRNRRSRYQPRIDLRLRGETGNDLERIRGNSTDGRAEVVLNYNLYAGGADQAAVAQSQKLISVAEDLREATCRDVRQDLRIALNDRQRLDTQLVFLETHVDTTDKARQAYLDQFQLGQRSLLDLLDTENEHFQAQRAFTNGKADHLIASARTLNGMGRLTRAVGVSRDGLPSQDDIGGREEGADYGCPQQWPEEGPGAFAYSLPTPAPLDSDGDGVPDADDLCPGTPPGTPVDSAGCAVKQEVVLNGVTFEFDSTVLTEPSKSVLNNAARILKANPETRVEVAGHTDSVGAAAYNLRLSQGRADSVVRYLVSQGVDHGQLSARGYGLTEPKASNETSEGRAVNRRVEFRVQ